MVHTKRYTIPEIATILHHIMDMITTTPVLCRLAEHGFSRLNEGMSHTLEILATVSRETDYFLQLQKYLEQWIQETASITTRCSASTYLKKAVLMLLRNLHKSMAIPE